MYFTHLSEKHTFINNLIHLSYNSVQTPLFPHPQINVVCSWRKTWGFKVQQGVSSRYNIDLGGWGGCTQGEGYAYFMQKRDYSMEYLNTFVPYCRFLKNWKNFQGCQNVFK